ncbi:unnamed protein product [Ectocarpus sp. CCAP 1310/34]|nr:unnamed protein product [Ectocarpus sp. CCAP 1310/34]
MINMYVQVRGFRLGPVFLAEMDASAYNTAPADPHKRGVRLSIRGGVAASLCFSVEKSGAINPFTTGRVVIPTTSLVVTTVHGLRLRAGKIEARVCDRDAGSRGSLLLRLRRVALAQGSGDVATRTPPPRASGGTRGQQHGFRSRSTNARSPAARAGSEAFVVVDGGEGMKADVARSEERHTNLPVGEAGASAASTTADGAGLDGNEADGSTTAGVGAASNSGGMVRVEISDGSSSGSDSDVDVSDCEDDEDDDDDTDVGFIDGGFADNGSYYAGGGGLQSSSLQAHAHAAAAVAAGGLSSFDTDGIDLAVGYADTAAAIDSRSGNPAAAAAAAGCDDHRGGPKKPLVRGRSARRFWASRGGVPPRLELLPSHSHGHDGALADVDESSADEGTAAAGRHDSPSVRKRKGGYASSRGMEEPASTRASGDGTASEAPKAGAAVAAAEPGVAADITTAAATAGVDGGGDEDGDENASAAAHRQVGSGRWDEHLQAVTRAAWLGSKQASSRGFNSNASSVSAASASNAPTTPIAATAAMAAAAAAAGAAQSSAGGAGGASKRFFPPHKSGGGDSCYSARSSRDLGDVDGREGAPAGALPISSPPSPLPAAAAALPDADVGGDGVTGAGTPGGSSRPEGGSDGRKTRATAAATADERVAGSGFLYRVVFDGLNLLITLKLR